MVYSIGGVVAAAPSTPMATGIGARAGIGTGGTDRCRRHDRRQTYVRKVTSKRNTHKRLQKARRGGTCTTTRHKHTCQDKRRQDKPTIINTNPNTERTNKRRGKEGRLTFLQNKRLRGTSIHDRQRSLHGFRVDLLARRAPQVESTYHREGKSAYMYGDRAATTTQMLQSESIVYAESTPAAAVDGPAPPPPALLKAFPGRLPPSLVEFKRHNVIGTASSCKDSKKFYNFGIL